MKTDKDIEVYHSGNEALESVKTNRIGITEFVRKVIHTMRSRESVEKPLKRIEPHMLNRQYPPLEPSESATPETDIHVQIWPPIKKSE